MLRNLRMAYYAVARGRETGIFRSWAECEKQVGGFSGAAFKKFKTAEEAQQFIDKGPAAKKQNVQSKLNFSATIDKISKAPKSKTKEDCSDEMFLNLPEYPDAPTTSRQSQTAEKPKNDFPMKIPYVPPKPTTEKTYKGLKFNEDASGFVHVYTDGSSLNNGKYTAAAGLGVYFGENHSLNVSAPVTGRPTNNAGEIQAAIRAIRDAQSFEIKRLNIFTDSQFLIKSVCQWIPAWKQKGWKVAKGKSVVNQKDFKELDALIEGGNMLLQWSYIPAHKGKHGNEEADRLAKIGASLYRTKREREEGGSGTSDMSDYEF